MGGNSRHTKIRDEIRNSIGEGAAADASAGTAGTAIFRCPHTLSLALMHSFHTVSLVLVTLLLPLSLLLLAQLSLVPQLLDFPASSSHLFSTLLFVTLLIPHVLVPFVCLSTLLYSSSSTCRTLKPNLHLAWAVVSISEVAVGLGIETTIAAGFVTPMQLDRSTYDDDGDWIKGVVFFVGVYETTMFWSKAFARRVVDDTVYGTTTMEEEETAAKRVVLGVALGVVWVVMLRREVERLGSMAGVVVDGWHGCVCRLVGMLLMAIGVIRIGCAVKKALGLCFLHPRVEELLLPDPSASRMEKRRNQEGPKTDRRMVRHLHFHRQVHLGPTRGSGGVKVVGGC